MRKYYLIITLLSLASFVHAGILDPLAQIDCKKEKMRTTITINKEAKSHLMDFGDKKCSFKVDSSQHFKRGSEEHQTVYFSLVSCEKKKVTDKNFNSFGHLKKGFIVFNIVDKQVLPMAHIYENSQAVSCEAKKINSKDVLSIGKKS